MTAPATSMLSAKLKMAQRKPIGVDVEIDEIAHLPEHQPVVTVANRAGHDEAQSEIVSRQSIDSSASNEKPVRQIARPATTDGEGGEDTWLLNTPIPRPKSPEGSGIITCLAVPGCSRSADDGARRRRADPGSKLDRLRPEVKHHPALRNRRGQNATSRADRLDADARPAQNLRSARARGLAYARALR